jgi:hypothetical protein
MSRKHYEKLARWVARERDENRRAKMACDLADILAEDNPRFDRGIWHSRIADHSRSDRR